LALICLASALGTAACSHGSNDTPPLPVTSTTSCGKDAQSTVEIESCAARELAQLDPVIANLVSQLKTKVPAGHAVDVDAAQEAWREYVDQTCQVAALHSSGGSLQISKSVLKRL